MLLRLVRPLLRRHARGGATASRTTGSSHLYLVLDDWKEGYSLHMLDLKAGGSGDGEHDDDDPSPRRLPEPLLRLGFRTLGSWPRISALGSKIIFMGQRRPDQFRIEGDDGDGDDDDDDKRRRLILVYDTTTAAVDVSHHLPDDMRLVTNYDAVAAGKDRLYLLLPQFERSPEPPRRPRPEPERGVDMAPYPYVEKVERVKTGTRLYLLLPDPFERSPEPFRPPAPDRAAVGMSYLEKVEKVYLEEKKSASRGRRMLYSDDDEKAGRCRRMLYGDDDEKDKLTLHRNRLTERWSWRTSPSPPPFSGGRRITGHALHPDGRTIFVSVEKTHAGRHPDDEEGTFSYDTERAEWTHRGDWRLPFKGQAHYDRHLDAWVGIGAFSGGHPRLVACDVVHLADAADGTAPPPPKWTACEETLTFLGALRKRRVGDPKLVSMGGGEFCVIESAQRAGFKLGLGSLGDGDKFELRVTVFHAKYGENGELLMTTSAAAAAGSGLWQSHTYVLSRYLLNFHALAFWM